eukprot:TRINITY_DN2050_c0_g2_i1.p1 TRINITY_DN2050_c0_g2~~TRINITY_DN2050_c0_g2_i1.p1  ORF type:complete len:186 (+),score=25.33 TRINITY_DN2050_c0_g2_i1:249-806(+)
MKPSAGVFFSFLLLITILMSITLAHQGCIPSTLKGYTCQSEISPNEYTFHWAVEPPVVHFAMQVSAQGYAAMGWSVMGLMAGSDAVVAAAPDGGLPGYLSTYKLNSYKESEVVPTSSFSVSNGSCEQTNGMTIARFTRSVADQGSVPWSVASPVNFIFAWSPDNHNVSYHGLNNVIQQIVLGGPS